MALIGKIVGSLIWGVLVGGLIAAVVTWMIPALPFLPWFVVLTVIVTANTLAE